MRLDLHIHTTASDGAFSPSEVVRFASEGGLDLIAITDHDTTGGVEPARAAAAALMATDARPVRVVTGTELSSTHDGQEIHVLGYGVDPAAPGIAHHRERARAMRRERMQLMLEKLSGLGIEIPLEQVLAHSGPDGEMVGRPHLAAALVEAGHVSDVRAAFDHFIGNGAAAFVATALQTPIEAIEVIAEAGGLSIWAHPPPKLFADLVPVLVEAGLHGVEIYRPYNSEGWIQELETAAVGYDLLRTGGSDWHNLERNTRLGDFAVQAEQVAEFLERLQVA